jgi:hypothetical protein
MENKINTLIIKPLGNQIIFISSAYFNMIFSSTGINT